MRMAKNPKIWTMRMKDSSLGSILLAVVLIRMATAMTPQ